MGGIRKKTGVDDGIIVICFLFAYHNLSAFVSFEARAVGWRGIDWVDFVSTFVAMFGRDANALQDAVKPAEVVPAQLTMLDMYVLV